MREGAFLTAEGVPGGCNYTGQEGTIEVIRFRHKVYRPVDPDDVARVHGERRHGAVSIVKFVDKATPLLVMNCCQGNVISEITVKWYKQPTDESADPVHYFTHRFENCHVIEVNMEMEGGTAQGGNEHLETVTFGYSRGEWCHEDAGTMFVDEARG